MLETNPSAKRETLPYESLPVVGCGDGFDMLSGIRVLDLTSSVAGPYASMLLGDMGAEVIKVERAGGDDARAWGPPFLGGESLWFLSVNRNKQSIVVDYSTAEGLAVLCSMVSKSDVMIVNSPRRVLEKLGIGPDQMQACNPKLIYVAITGFGLEGERADWPCYDLIAEGYSGVMDLTGERDGPPQKVGAPAADMLAGHDAAFATVSALVRRLSRDKGAVVDVALVDSMTRFLTCRIVPYLGSGDVPSRSGATDSVISVYQAFRTADGSITIGLGNDGIWRRFWDALERPEFHQDPAFASNAARREKRSQIVSEIQRILLEKPSSHWLPTLRAARVPCGPINRIDEIAGDAELIRRGVFYRLEQNGRSVPQVGPSILIDRQAGRPQRPPPLLGEHTEQLMRETFGFQDRQIAELAERKIISGETNDL